MNLIEQAIESYWGERCPDYEEGCVVCEAWRDYDNLLMDNKIANEIASKLALVNNNMLIEDLLRHPADLAIRNAISRLIVERKTHDVDN
jgi:hypothetical protein